MSKVFKKMNFQLPSEVILTDAFRLGEGMIFSYDDARKFLLTDNHGKNMVDRLISYLICLKIISPLRPKWSESLLIAVDMYYSSLKYYFKDDYKNALRIVSTKSESIMSVDFPRTLGWFNEMAPTIGAEISKEIDVLEIISRIFAILEREHPELQYTQGFDRYAYSFFAMALSFCQKGSLPIEFGEAITYHLVCNTISLLPMTKLLDDQQKLMEHFDRLDKVLMNYDYQKYKLLTDFNASILFFGVRFEMLLFADEHSFEETLRIWDQIFGRLESYEYMINAFTLAHVHQAKIEDDCPNVLESILHNQKWDVDKLILDANALLHHQKSIKETLCEACCPKLTRFHGYSIVSDFVFFE